MALAQAGADPNLASQRAGRTALHYMAAVGSVQGVAALLAAGADVDVVDKFSRRCVPEPLHAPRRRDVVWKPQRYRPCYAPAQELHQAI